MIDSVDLQAISAPTNDAILSLSVEAGHAYLIQRASDPVPPLVEVGGTRAATVKKLGSRTLGVAKD